MNPVLIALIGAVGGVAAAAIPVWLTRKNHPSRRVQDGASIVEAAEGVVGLLRAELDRLRDDVTALRAELGNEERRTDTLAAELNTVKYQLAAYRRGVGLLIAQLVALGHHPAWQPDEDVDGTPI